MACLTRRRQGGKFLSDWCEVNWAKVAWTFFFPFTDLLKSVRNDHFKCIPDRNTGMFKAEKNKVFDLKEFCPWKSWDKISTQVPRVQLETACQKILWGQMWFGIQYFKNLRKAVWQHLQ